MRKRKHKITVLQHHIYYNNQISILINFYILMDGILG